MRRKEKLRLYFEQNIIGKDQSTGMCYHDVPEGNSKDYEAGKYWVCGIWFEGYKFCPGQRRPCIFELKKSSNGAELPHINPFNGRCNRWKSEVEKGLLSIDKAENILDGSRGYKSNW